jgi:hypothetical protein
VSAPSILVRIEVASPAFHVQRLAIRMNPVASSPAAVWHLVMTLQIAAPPPAILLRV